MPVISDINFFFYLPKKHTDNSIYSKYSNFVSLSMDKKNWRIFIFFKVNVKDNFVIETVQKNDTVLIYGLITSLNSGASQNYAGHSRSSFYGGLVSICQFSEKHQTGSNRMFSIKPLFWLCGLQQQTH